MNPKLLLARFTVNSKVHCFQDFRLVSCEPIFDLTQVPYPPSVRKIGHSLLFKGFSFLRYENLELVELDGTRRCASSLYQSMSSSLPKDEREVYVRAILRSLRHAGVKFLRFQSLDAGNAVRVKAVPLEFIERSCGLDSQVAMAEVVFGGLPSFGDYIQEASGLDATKVLRLIPDIGTLRVLPYATRSAIVLCTLRDTITNDHSELCCRSLLRKIVQEAKDEHKIAFSVGSELEFSLFDFKTKQPVDETNFAHSGTLNQQDNFIEKLYDALIAQEIDVEQIHAESGPGQVEVVLQYCRNPVEMADRIVMTRETITSVARSCNMLALFLPKIYTNKAGNGNHLHISICDATTGENLFPAKHVSTPMTTPAEPTVKHLSPMARSFIEGILCHLPALLAVTLPTTNSFRRVGPGCWTGSSIKWAFNDKESPIRLAASLETGTWNRFEYKLMDCTANPYLAMATILSAGLEGITTQAALRPVAKTTDSNADRLPLTLSECLDVLEDDEFIKSKISPKLLRAYLACRRAEVEHAKERPLEAEVTEAIRLA